MHDCNYDDDGDSLLSLAFLSFHSFHRPLSQSLSLSFNEKSGKRLRQSEQRHVPVCSHVTVHES